MNKQVSAVLKQSLLIDINTYFVFWVTYRKIVRFRFFYIFIAKFFMEKNVEFFLRSLQVTSFKIFPNIQMNIEKK